MFTLLSNELLLQLFEVQPDISDSFLNLVLLLLVVEGAKVDGCVLYHGHRGKNEDACEVRGKPD